MNEFVFNFDNVISFKSVLTSNIYLYYDVLLSLHCVYVINEINNLYITYVIISCFSFGWIYNYLCNQYLSPLPWWVRILTRRSILDTTKLVSDLRHVSVFLVGGLRFPLRIKLIFYHGITEILVKVALNTITLTHLLVIVLCVLFWHVVYCHSFSIVKPFL